MEGLRRLQSRHLVAPAALALGLAACGWSSSPPAPQPSPGLQAVIAASEVLVGDQRLPIGIIDRNRPVNDARVHVRAVFLGGGAEPGLEADAPFRGEGLQGKGVYVASLRFDAAGPYLVEISATRPDGRHAEIRLPLTVSTHSQVPAPGQPAPQSRNQTIRDVADVSEIDTGQPPNDMHDLSIADAIAQHRPTIVVFATPAFCQTSMCAPVVHAVQSLEPAYRDRLAFIHVEIYRNFRSDPVKRQLTPTVLEWRLQTEPWVFLIDSRGLVRDRFEGPVASDELKAAVERLLANP